MYLKGLLKELCNDYTMFLKISGKKLCASGIKPILQLNCMTRVNV